MIPQLLVDFYQAWGEDAHIEHHQGSVEEIVDQVHQEGISELGIVFTVCQATGGLSEHRQL
ncbi:hypothetical protein [Dysosmobacter welbionis]|uniref:hypothetical protein n=1 Tax=Dysosmobacter welbionis TaxID=2093857 RepID=UPI00235203F7|nr:hypothetical protein [Dysosmobacter welbionis]